MTESSGKTVVQLVQELGLPVVLTGVILYALWIRTSSFIQLQHEYATKQNEACQEQTQILKEIRDALRGVRPHE